MHTNIHSGHGAVLPAVTRWHRAQGPAGLAMDTMECSAVAPGTPQS